MEVLHEIFVCVDRKTYGSVGSALHLDGQLVMFAHLLQHNKRNGTSIAIAISMEETLDY